MGEIKEKYTPVIAQKDALRTYLDSMLFESTTEDDQKNSSISQISNLKNKSDSSHVASIMKSSVVAQAKITPLHDSQTPIIPEYAKNNFTVLTFKVAGLAMAVPLAEVSSIESLSDNIETLTDKQKWIIGTQVYKRGKAFIVDTHELVIPEKRHKKRPKSKYGANTRVILSADGKWGLLCDELGTTLVLSASDVCWRTMNTHRSWLAGTMVKHACALLDFKKISWYE